MWKILHAIHFALYPPKCLTYVILNELQSAGKTNGLNKSVYFSHAFYVLFVFYFTFFEAINILCPFVSTNRVYITIFELRLTCLSFTYYNIAEDLEYRCKVYFMNPSWLRKTWIIGYDPDWNFWRYPNRSLLPLLLTAHARNSIQQFSSAFAISMTSRAYLWLQQGEREGTASKEVQKCKRDRSSKRVRSCRSWPRPRPLHTFRKRSFLSRARTT